MRLGMAVHQAQVAKIDRRAVPYTYGLPVRVWSAHTRTGPYTRMGVPYAYGASDLPHTRTGQNTFMVYNKYKCNIAIRAKIKVRPLCMYLLTTVR